MYCKHLYETNYCQWVCGKDGKNGKFIKLGQGNAIEPVECELCKYYESGESDPEVIEKFREYDKLDTLYTEMRECQFYGDGDCSKCKYYEKECDGRK